MKKALTYTVVAGSRACPNDCYNCISDMTPNMGIGKKEPKVNWGIVDRGFQDAMKLEAGYFLISSKGEATLFPAQVTEFLHRSEPYVFIRRELQTEGSVIMKGGRTYDQWLRVWKDHGLDVVAISMYHYDNKKNKEPFNPRDGKFYDLDKLMEKLQKNDLLVRLSCVQLKGYVDSIEEVSRLIDFAKERDIFQLTLRRADKPANPLNKEKADYVDQHRVDDRHFNEELAKFLKEKGTLCDKLPHGALIYEVGEQNVAVTTGLDVRFGDEETQSCLRTKPDEDEIRELIYIPPNIITTSWENVHGGRIL